MTRRLEGFTFIRPAPRCTMQAAATSLTSFINVSGQPHSRKGLTSFFLGRKVHAPPISHFLADFPGFSSGWKPPTLVGGERSEKGGERSEKEAALQGREKGLEPSLPCARGPRAAEGGARNFRGFPSALSARAANAVPPSLNATVTERLQAHTYLIHFRVYPKGHHGPACLSAYLQLRPVDIQGDEFPCLSINPVGPLPVERVLGCFGFQQLRAMACLGGVCHCCFYGICFGYWLATLEYSHSVKMNNLSGVRFENRHHVYI